MCKRVSLIQSVLMPKLCQPSFSPVEDPLTYLMSTNMNDMLVAYFRQNLMQIWKKVAEDLEGQVQVAKVDAMLGGSFCPESFTMDISFKSFAMYV